MGHSLGKSHHLAIKCFIACSCTQNEIYLIFASGGDSNLQGVASPTPLHEEVHFIPTAFAILAKRHGLHDPKEWDGEIPAMIFIESYMPD